MGVRQLMQIKVVWGPPGSGKTTFVNDRKGENDLIYDFDTLMRDLSGLDLYDRNNNLLYYLISIRDEIIWRLKNETSLDSAWLIFSYPEGDLKASLDDLSASFVLMDTDKQTCIDRINADPARKNKTEWIQVIENWFDKYNKQNQASNKKEVDQRVKHKFWNFIKKNESSGELQLYGEIADSTWWGDEVTPKDFKADLDSLGNISTLDVYINSPGGDVFAGQAIYSMLKRCKAQINVYVDGLAASAASLVAMAGDKIIMPENAMMMIHNAWTIVQGNANDLRKQAEAMDKVDASIKTAYLSKAPDLTQDKISEMMDAETWLSAQDAVDLGLADEIEDAKDYAASLRGRLFDAYRHVPDDLSVRAHKVQPMQDEEKMRQLKAKLSLELAL